MKNSAVLLRQKGLRATPARLSLLAVLSQAKQAMSIEALHSQLRSKGVDRVTLYRNSEALAKAGILRSVDLGHSHAHYELNDLTKHHHHLICESCGRVQDITVKDEARMINAATRRHNFITKSHSFEIFGLCNTCQ